MHMLRQRNEELEVLRKTTVESVWHKELDALEGALASYDLEYGVERSSSDKKKRKASSDARVRKRAT